MNKLSSYNNYFLEVGPDFFYYIAVVTFIVKTAVLLNIMLEPLKHNLPFLVNFYWTYISQNGVYRLQKVKWCVWTIAFGNITEAVRESV